jgi:hypothetical protein
MGKNPLVLSFGRNASVLNKNHFWTAGICAPRSTAHSEFRTPLAFRPLSGGGGVRNRGRTSPTVQISAPGSTAMKTIPDPPCLSTFKRGGGVRNRGCNFPTAEIEERRINDAHAAPPFSAALCLTCVGPSPVMSSSFHLSLAAMCHPSTSPFGPRGLLSFSSSTHLRHVSFSLHVSLLTKRCHRILSLPPPYP